MLLGICIAYHDGSTADYTKYVYYVHVQFPCTVLEVQFSLHLLFWPEWYFLPSYI